MNLGQPPVDTLIDASQGTVDVSSSIAWTTWFDRIFQILGNGLPQGVTAGVIGDEPTGLSVADAGRQFFVTTSADGLTGYYHTVIWTGTAWDFNGDPSGRFGDFQVDPGEGWQACDGTTTKRLTVGASLGEAAMAAPNEKANPSVHESGAVYSGAIIPAVAPAFAGTPVNSGPPSAGAGGTAGGFVGYSSIAHTHSVTATGTVDATGKQQLVSVLRYVRR